MKRNLKKVLSLAALFAISQAAHAAKKQHGAAGNLEEDYSSRSYSGSGRNELSADATFNYLRGTQPSQNTDSAPRLSVGGMFSDWIGLDFQGLYSMRSKNYLIGADLRLMATDWLYVKGGVGGYSDKTTRSFSVTPLLGGGIRARAAARAYFVTEANYHQVNHEEFISIGAGLGLFF